MRWLSFMKMKPKQFFECNQQKRACPTFADISYLQIQWLFWLLMHCVMLRFTKQVKCPPTLSGASLDRKEGSITAACKFIFGEATTTFVVLLLKELSTASSNDTGFKLWYSKTTEGTHTKDPMSFFPRSQRRILISNLQPLLRCPLK